MRRPLLAVAAILALAAPALAGGTPAVTGATAAPPPPAPHDWSGAYAGLGYGVSSGDFDLGPLAFPPLPANPRSLSSGDALSVHAGWLFQRGSLVWGGEIALTRLSDTTIGGATDEGVEQIIDLKARLGHAADRLLVYGILGYSSVHWDAPSTDAFTETGPAFGLGVDYAASDRVTVGLEYLSRRTSGRFDPPGRDFDLNVDTLSLRVGVRF